MMEGKGCTANVIMIVENMLICANAGDSRAVCYSFMEQENGMRVTPLSIDHKPDLPIEKMRV